MNAADLLVRSNACDAKIGVMRKRPPATAHSSFTLGSAAMEKINAVEGIVLSAEIKDALASFERRNLSPEQQRAELLSMFVRRA